MHQLTEYAVLLKTGTTQQAADLRRGLMAEHGWDGVAWLYARDTWLLNIRAEADRRSADSLNSYFAALDANDNRAADEAIQENSAGRLRQLVNDQNGHPAALSLAETALMFEAIRHPGIMRHVVEKKLAEAAGSDLIRHEVRGQPDGEIYVENSVVGLITALRPMLLRTVADYYALY